MILVCVCDIKNDPHKGLRVILNFNKLFGGKIGKYNFKI